MIVQKIRINDAKQLVSNYEHAMNIFKQTGKVIYPLNTKKHSITHIINSFKLNHAYQNQELYKSWTDPVSYFYKPQIHFKEWDDIRDILLVLINNNACIKEKEVNMENLKKDYEKFIEIADDMKLNDELYWDRIYVLIGIKKPTFFLITH